MVKFVVRLYSTTPRQSPPAGRKWVILAGRIAHITGTVTALTWVYGIGGNAISLVQVDAGFKTGVYYPLGWFENDALGGAQAYPFAVPIDLSKIEWGPNDVLKVEGDVTGGAEIRLIVDETDLKFGEETSMVGGDKKEVVKKH